MIPLYVLILSKVREIQINFPIAYIFTEGFSMISYVIFILWELGIIVLKFVNNLLKSFYNLIAP